MGSGGIRRHMKNKHKKAQTYKGKIKAYINIQARYGKTGDHGLDSVLIYSLQIPFNYMEKN